MLSKHWFWLYMITLGSLCSVKALLIKIWVVWYMQEWVLYFENNALWVYHFDKSTSPVCIYSGEAIGIYSVQIRSLAAEIWPLKVIVSQYSLIVHYCGLEGFDGTQGTQGSWLDSGYITHRFWNNIWCMMEVVKGRIRVGCKRACLVCSEHSGCPVNEPCVVLHFEHSCNHRLLTVSVQSALYYGIAASYTWESRLLRPTPHTLEIYGPRVVRMLLGVLSRDRCSPWL